MSEILDQIVLPDIQNEPRIPSNCANVPIQKVGFHNICVPCIFLSHTGEKLYLEVSFDVYASLDASKRGLNMSRIPITIHRFCSQTITYDLLGALLKELKEQLEVERVYVTLSFRYPMNQKSIKSNMEGIQYYNTFFRLILDENDEIYHFMGLDFLYSSSCPCSSALAAHSRIHSNQEGIAHSQRSIAKLLLYIDKGLSISEVIMLCRRVLKTETQVIVKRADEQAFAIANGSYQKFVEDASRQLYGELAAHTMIKAFCVSCIHQESLHSYDAVADISYGKFPEISL